MKIFISHFALISFVILLSIIAIPNVHAGSNLNSSNLLSWSTNFDEIEVEKIIPPGSSKILLFGGTHYIAPDITRPLNDVWESNTTIDDWNLLTPDTVTPGTTKWSQRTYFASTYYKGKVFVAGGSNAPLSYHKYKDVWSTKDGVNWKRLTKTASWGGTEPDQGLISHTLTVFKNKLWIIGGYFDGGAGGQNGAWYSTDGIAWTETVDGYDHCLQTRFDHETLVFNNKIWLLGGYWAETKPDICSSTNGTDFNIELYEAPWGERTGLMAVVFQDKMWIFGGIQDNQVACSSDIWYSTDGINWIEGVSAPWTGRCFSDVVEVNGKLWLFGGDYSEEIPPPGYGLLNDVWSSEDGLTWIEVTENAPWYDRTFHNVVRVPSDF